MTETLIVFQVELSKDNKVYDSKQSSWWPNVRQVTGHEGIDHVNDHVKKSDHDSVCVCVFVCIDKIQSMTSHVDIGMRSISALIYHL